MASLKDWSDPDNSRYAALDYQPRSTNAWDLGAAIVARVDDVAPLKTKRGPAKEREVRKLAASLAADLLWAYKTHPLRSSGRTFNSNAYSKDVDGVGIHVFKKLFTGMVESGLVIIVRKGHWNRKQPFKGLKIAESGKVTRFRATDALVSLAREHGVVPDNLDDHFERTLVPPDELVELRHQSTRDHRYRKVRGAKVDFSHTKETRRIESALKFVNSFLAKQKIEGAGRYFLVRKFTLPEGEALENFRWDKHGRLYAQGGEDAYQQLPKEARLAHIRINGEEVVEIDITASYLTILHATLNEPYDPDRDPYQTIIDADPECSSHTRSVVKFWVNATIGKGEPLKSWPKKQKEKYAQEFEGRSLSGDHPIKRIGSLVMTHLPILKRLGEPGTTPFDLMYVESEGIFGTLIDLAHRGIPALPIHDSVMVPRSVAKVAAGTLRDLYKRALVKRGLTALTPAIKIKDQHDAHEVDLGTHEAPEDI